ncbi:MAG: replication-associated recombination protein A [Candidatus Omnitrophica bacterium]|nr:replication-associated recombination protein A [Candidatus Omnitrophota bacterium]
MKKASQNNSEDLFTVKRQKELLATSPLSARMRPGTLKEYAGQKHILGEGKLLNRAIAADRISSLILYGPPGCGKTTLAHCISSQSQAVFEKVNAVSSNVEELRKVLLSGRHRRMNSGNKTILFIDEIHRFNKAQQDVLMPDLEDGSVVLIGATVFNPFFSLVSPLLSRSLVFELQALQTEDILSLLKRALKDKERGLGMLKIKASPKALNFLADICDGDARKALNALEIGCLTTTKNKQGVINFSLKVAQESIQKKQVNYDQAGDAHYDTASAFIKSMRGSDPDAALYWMAKMIYAGEDHRFIARRICICAAEDVGNADPRAITVANAAYQITEFIGMPEARIPLAQAAVYVACAPKSNAVYLGIDKALSDVKNKRIQEVPTYLKDASYSGAKKMGHGQGYRYSHDYKDHYVAQDYTPKGVDYYHPTDLGFEKEMKQRLAKIRQNSTKEKKNPQNFGKAQKY